MRHYARAPIVEAVIEFRYQTAVAEKDIEKMRRKFRSRYATEEKMEQFEIQVGPKPVLKSSELIAYKYITADASYVLQAGPHRFSVSKYAPYTQWDDLIGRFREEQAEWQKIAGKRLTRVGVRFINRIDVPTSEEKMDSDDYLNLGVKLPDMLSPLNCQYNVGFSAELEPSKLGVNLKSGFVQPAIVGHVSILLDIDLFKNNDIPTRDNDLWELLTEIRNAKDEVFEACITDKTRQLIS